MALVQSDEMMVVDAEGGRRLQHRMAGREQGGNGLLHEGGGRPAVYLAVAVGERAAGARLVVDQHSREAGLRGEPRGSEACRSGAHHQHVAMVVDLGGRLLRRPLGVDRAQTRHGADARLEHMPVRPNEGLVVERRRDEAREAVEEGVSVRCRARRGVDAARHQPFAGCFCGGAGVGRGRRGAANVDQRVGLLDAGPPDAARPVILEAAADDRDVVGEQRRGDRVAGETRHSVTVEAEAQRARAIDGAAAGLETRGAHCACPPSSAVDDSTSCVTVSRSMTKNSLQFM